MISIKQTNKQSKKKAREGPLKSFKYRTFLFVFENDIQMHSMNQYCSIGKSIYSMSNYQITDYGPLRIIFFL